MKKLILSFLILSTTAFATEFNCTSYGIIDIYVQGTIGEDYQITVIDLPFTEKKETIKELDIDLTQDYSKFSLRAEQLAGNSDWFLTIDTENNTGWIEMDYRGIMKQREEIHCSFN